MRSFVGRIGGRASGGMNADEFKRACHVTAAHFVTLDFVMLTDERQLWTRGFHLEDRVRGDSIKIFSLIELEPGVHYSTGHGNSLVRTSVREALLADKIVLPVDLCDASISPRASFDGTAATVSPANNSSAAVIGSALSHVRALSATPSAASLGELQRTLGRLPIADDGWLDSFLALDGMQALLDVLSHSLQQQQMPPPTPPQPVLAQTPSAYGSPKESGVAQSPYLWSAPSEKFDRLALHPLLLIRPRAGAYTYQSIAARNSLGTPPGAAREMALGEDEMVQARCEVGNARLCDCGLFESRGEPPQ